MRMEGSFALMPFGSDPVDFGPTDEAEITRMIEAEVSASMPEMPTLRDRGAQRDSAFAHRQLCEQNRRLDLEKKAAIGKIVYLNEENVFLKKSADELRSEVTKLRSLQDQIHAVGQLATQAKQEAAQAMAGLVQAREDAAQANARFAQSDARSEQLKNEVAQAREDATQANARSEQLENEVAQAREDAAQAKAVSEQLENEVAQAREDAAQAKAVSEASAESLDKAIKIISATAFGLTWYVTWPYTATISMLSVAPSAPTAAVATSIAGRVAVTAVPSGTVAKGTSWTLHRWWDPKKPC